jgi:hypothetical protein
MKNVWLKKIALAAASIVICVVFVLLLELGTRVIWPEINAQDTDPALMRQKAFGKSYGWEPNASGISFGVPVEIDRFGYRKMDSPENASESWVILGDSVTFGVGVETGDTFAQLLQNDRPDVRIWNTSVIGYNFENHADALENFLSDPARASSVKNVMLFVCLNDVDLGNAIETTAAAKTLDSSAVQTILSFLRRNSRLYMRLKTLLSDRSKYYFQHDFSLYTDENESFRRSVDILDKMNRSLKERGIAFTVVILPYEYQVRTRNEQDRVPQQLLSRRFDAAGIDYIDAYKYFEMSGDTWYEDFLYGDFCHLSKKGHRVVYDLVKKEIDASGNSN